MNSYSPEATAEDVVRSCRLKDDDYPSRSLLETGIVDERQIPIWPEFCEDAHTRITTNDAQNIAEARALRNQPTRSRL